MPRRLFIVLGALVAAVAGAPAYAHVDAQPAFLASGESASIEFAGPNERDAQMTGFSIRVPSGLVVEHAHEAEGWSESGAGRTASWTGGSLFRNDTMHFRATIAADIAPGSVEVLARQLYADGGVVRWPVRITVTPAPEGPSQNLALAGVVGLLGVLLVVVVAMLAWRRRAAA